MRLLLDTHLLLWVAMDSARLSALAREAIADPSNEKFFSAASLWELAIKSTAKPASMGVDLAKLESELLLRKYVEVEVSSRAARETARLPLIHKDPFDRLLIAQAIVENLTLLTADATVATYPGPIRRV